ncbi:hypothetical protein KDK95_23255 [Actinospica sp. MGRD01-02]|uniref:PKD domain-containing protein n=1 Tax=Actinospica acidithermotolerans TaxID=2828514 RepID=A0A941II46_9ACTN|nr:hypothetical protein [Actinospica acidithermotolerans]MBR7829245.1 hypothetical protein [Actinospica acidithermotolerans]
MRKRIAAAVTAALLPMAGAVTVPMTASAAAGGTLYVDKMSPYCSDTGAGAGAAATPYCTIQAAANAATAGDTVQIFGGAANAVAYGENVTITHSGSAGAPITFESVGLRSIVGGLGKSNTLAVKGASYVNLVGFNAGSVDLQNASHVMLTKSIVQSLTVEKGSSSVSIERDDLASVTVASGVSGTDLATNIIQTSSACCGVSVVGATGTDIVNNSIDVVNYPSASFAGISVTGGASGTSIENNVIWGNTEGLPELLVDASSAAGTNEGYNILDLNGTNSSVPYSWAGTTYTTLASFQVASAQGTADLVEDAFTVSSTSDLLTSDDPAVGSANSAAPGLPATDFYGNTWTDDTAVTSTGAGPETYYDRGAVNLAEYNNATVNAAIDEQSVAADIDVSGLLLGSTGTITLNWGDGSAAVTAFTNNGATYFTDYSDLVQLHEYASVGTYTITATIVDVSGTRTFTTQITTGGSTYVPVTPKRVLDTRAPIGVATAGKVIAGHSIAVDVVSGVSGAPAASTITAVVLNVTVTQPVAGGFVSAYPDGTAVPKSSNLNFTTNETVPNLTTVMIGLDGKVDLYATATTHLVADVEGYYVASAAGAGYHPTSPTRVLDTRKGTGAPAQAIGPGKSITLKLAGTGPIPASGVTAVAMNVTATQPSTGGVIIAYPAGGSTPNVSNVNYSTGETVPNMAIVKLGTGGAVEFTNSSKGTVQLVVDVSGYYTTTGGDAFVPMTPWRALDTRNGTGQETSKPIAAAANAQAVWWFDDEFDASGYWSGGPQDAAGLVLNVTVTQPTAPGVLIAYAGSSVPTASNINFSAGETVPAMVMVGTIDDDTSLYNQSKGTTQVVADVFGYFS